MSDIILDNVSIKFRLYHDNAPSLKNLVANIFKQRGIQDHDQFLALKNISLKINSGDRLGIVGHNGAGKSTLLKALCGIYEPTSGKIIVNGKIAPLLEIGAGFHPEFTGRENIYLNGAILGYTTEQLKKIEQEVIRFAEVEDFADMPVKYYSTGMYMRLAFSLATAIHPDILIIDEVFAGGDVNFIRKAKARMLSMMNKADIIIMVSHEHELIKTLCNRVVYLKRGEMIADGKPDEIIDFYLKNG